MPGGVAKTFIPTKDAELKNDYDEWLARVVCFAFSISPQPFVDRMNRATAETAHDAALAEGLAPIQSWIKQLVDYVIVTEFDAPDLEFQWRDDSAPDPATAATVAHTYVASGIKSINEVRAEIGLDPVAGGDAPLVLTTGGPVPLAGLGAATANAVAARPAIGKAGYDPDQPRDWHGRWTGGGSDGGDSDGGDSDGGDQGGESGDASGSDGGDNSAGDGGGNEGAAQVADADTGIQSDANEGADATADADETAEAPKPEEQQKQLDELAATALPTLRAQAQAQQQVAVQLIYTDSTGKYQLSAVANGGWELRQSTFDQLEATLPKAYEGVSAALVGHYINFLNQGNYAEVETISLSELDIQGREQILFYIITPTGGIIRYAPGGFATRIR